MFNVLTEMLLSTGEFTMQPANPTVPPLEPAKAAPAITVAPLPNVTTPVPTTRSELEPVKNNVPNPAYTESCAPLGTVPTTVICDERVEVMVPCSELLAAIETGTPKTVSVDDGEVGENVVNASELAPTTDTVPPPKLRRGNVIGPPSVSMISVPVLGPSIDATVSREGLGPPIVAPAPSDKTPVPEMRAMPCKVAPFARDTAPVPAVTRLVPLLSTIGDVKASDVLFATVPAIERIGLPLLDTMPCTVPALITIGVFCVVI